VEADVREACRPATVLGADVTSAVPHADPDDPDATVPWHYTDPHGEQRRLASGEGYVDLSHRGVVRVTGPDRLDWLHSLTSQRLDRLAPGQSATALLLDPHGHVEHELHLVDDGDATWIIVEPGAAPALTGYLESMRFLLRVAAADVTAETAVVWEPHREPVPGRPTWLVPPEWAGLPATDAGGDAARYVPARPGVLVGREVLVPRAEVTDYLAQAGPPAGTWALEALRVAAGVPRMGRETDHRTIPHEVGWIGPAVHLDKGCYRGQETVARTHNLGRPPRRLVLLHLDGSAEHLPAHGAAVLLDGRTVGWVGTAARHYELGPVALAVVKRSVPVTATLLVDGVAAAQEVIVSAG
jgi:folate-binding protein YgfZ